jgi:hypothetical protein
MRMQACIMQQLKKKQRRGLSRSTQHDISANQRNLRETISPRIYFFPADIADQRSMTSAQICGRLFSRGFIFFPADKADQRSMTSAQI